MSKFSQRYELEARTYELFDEYREAQTEFDSSSQIVGMVFRAMWSASLDVDKINRIGCAMAGYKDWDAQPALTRLVKAKVLRSRVIRGVRHYEVNY